MAAVAVAPKAAAAPQAAPRPVAPLTPPKAPVAAFYRWPCCQVQRSQNHSHSPARPPPPTNPLANDAARAPTVVVIRRYRRVVIRGEALAQALPPPVVVPVAAPAPICEAEPPSPEADGHTDNEELEMVVIPKAAAADPPGDTTPRVMFPRGSVCGTLPEVIFPDVAPAAMNEEAPAENEKWVVDPPPVPPEVLPPTNLERRPLVPRPPAGPPTGEAAVASAANQKRNLVNLGW